MFQFATQWAHHITRCMLLLSFVQRSQQWETVRPQDFGAVADGVHNDTLAVVAATSHCHDLGGCELLFANGIFLTGPFNVHSNCVVNIVSTIRAAPKDQWVWRTPALMTGYNLENVSIQGNGTIDGNGEPWWNATHNDLEYRPFMLTLDNITVLKIEGVLFLNSPNHNILLNECMHVRIRQLRVLAPMSSPNTDGVNFAGGFDQSIVDSHISNGDDCVSIVATGGSRLGPPSEPFGYGGNVVVANMTCINGHGISIGSIAHGVVTNVTVENINMYSSENGARIKTYPNHTGEVSGIVYRNMTMHGVAIAILIDGKYCPRSQKPYPCPPGSHSVSIHDVVFEDIRGTVASSSGRVGTFDCTPLSPCRNVSLNNIHLTSTHTTPTFSCSNITGSSVNVSPPSCVN